MRNVIQAVLVVAALAEPCAGWISGPSQLSLRVGLGHAVTASTRLAAGDVRVTRPDVGAKFVAMVSRREAIAGVGISLLTLLPSDATADMTLNSFKKSYFRWVPRIEAGRDFLVLELGANIDKENWPEVLKAFELTSVAQEGSVKAQQGLDGKSSRVDRDLITPLKIWTTSFSEKSNSPKQRKLEQQVTSMKEAMEKIRVAAGGDGASPDPDTASDAWESARVAFNQYVKVANKGMTMQVRQLTEIPEDSAAYVAAPPRPVNTYSQTGQATQRFQYCEKKDGQEQCVK